MWWDEGNGGGRRRRTPSGTNPFFFLLLFLDFIYFGCGNNCVMLMFTYFGFWNSEFEVMIDDFFVNS